MAKITSIIDIGSNSCRMVVYQKTSRYAFNLLKEVKSRVVLSENSFQNSILHENAMLRTIEALKDFYSIAKSLKSRKILVVATAALRNANNRAEFIKRVRDEVGLSIKIIDGVSEAKFGAIAVLNLLDKSDFISVDIGGGSTELSIVKNKKIIDNISLDIGTIKLKEKFFDKNKHLSKIQQYIEHKLDILSSKYSCKTVVTIGGTLRSYAKMLHKYSSYPVPGVHGYSYDGYTSQKHLYEIAGVKKERLKDYGVKKERYDTFREGAIIFSTILKKLNANKVVTSGVGVREGVYLYDLLRSNNTLFPQNFSLCVKSLSDRFINDEAEANFNKKLSSQIFNLIKDELKLDIKYIKALEYATKLSRVGISLNYYDRDLNNFNFLLNGLSYGFSHEDRVLISLISAFGDNKSQFINIYKKYQELLPSLDIVANLSKIVRLSKAINADLSNDKIILNYKNNNLSINPKRFSRVANEYIKKIKFENITVLYE